MNNILKKPLSKKTAAEQLFLLAASLVLGYAFALLRTFNTVTVFCDYDLFPAAFGVRMALYTCCFYAAATAIIRTKLGAELKKIFKVFDTEIPFDPLHIICCAALFYIMYTLIITDPYDFPVHADAALDYFDWRDLKLAFNAIPYPMWHILVNLTNKMLFIPTPYCTGIVSAGFYTAEYCIIRKLMVTFNKETALKNIKYIDILTFTFMFLQPFFIPWFSLFRHNGQGTPNIWHNPTIVCSYPFALICTYLFIRLLEKYKNGRKIQTSEFVRSGVYLLLSVAAKPSFIQIFIPAAGLMLIFMFIKSMGKNLAFALRYILSCVPAGLYCIFIFINNFFSSTTPSDGGVALGFFTVWRTKCPNIPISFCIGCAFPLAYLLFSRKRIYNKLALGVAWLTLACGAYEYALLYEQGSRWWHGNFGWGFLTGQTIVFCFTAVDWIKPLFEKNKSVTVPLIIYVLNIMFGIAYYIDLYNNHLRL